MKRWIGLALILVPILSPASAFWDGNAALQRGDASFEAGMFGASNSFAPDTQVFVQNLDTGKTTTVTITGRVTGQSDILVLLSPPAAAALGIKSGTLASVRLTIAPRATASAASSVAEQTTTQDPDLNPSAAYGGPTQAASSAASPGTTAASTTPATNPTTATAPRTAPAEPTPSLESLPSAQAPVAAAEAPVPSTAPEVPPVETPADTSTQTAQTQTADTQTADTQTADTQTSQATTQVAATPSGPSAAELKAASDAAILADASSRTPQKKVFLPPREDKTFAYVPPAPTQTAQTTTVAENPKNTTPPDTTTAAPPAPQITEAIGETGATPAPASQEDLALAEAAAPEESVPTEIVGADGAGPAPAPEAATVALDAPEPIGEDKPPVVAETPAPVQTEVTDPAAVPPVSPPAVVALVSPEPPAPAAESPTVVASVQNPTTTQQTTSQQTTSQQTTAQQTTATQQAAPASRPTQSETWYVQLAAYATEKGAQDAAARLASTYPTQVIAPATAGSRVFRVVVGPLNKAESGAVLVWFRSKGFPDAFVKQE